jgi:hypothetical protein
MLYSAAAVLAQDRGAVGGPSLGWVFDGVRGAIFPLRGVPAVSILGEPPASGVSIAASARGQAIFLDRDGAATLLDEAGLRPLPGARQAAARLMLSPTGSAAALYYDSDGAVQIFTGLPDAPQLARTTAVGEPPVALSDDGASILTLERKAREGEVLRRYDGGAASQQVYPARRVTAAVFAPGSDTAIVAEPHVVKLLSPAFGVQTVSDGLKDVTAVAGSSDGGRVFIATRSGRLIVHDLASSAEDLLQCECRPSALVPLRGGTAFLLNAPGDAPLWLLDAAGSEPRLHFVAAAGGEQ